MGCGLISNRGVARAPTPRSQEGSSQRQQAIQQSQQHRRVPEHRVHGASGVETNSRDRHRASGSGGPAARNLPSRMQDYAFCHECGTFFQLNPQRTAECTRCSSTFVQFLRQAGGENWVAASSNLGRNFSFDDQLDNSISASMDAAQPTKRPTQAAFLRSLPLYRLTAPEFEERSKLEKADPKCHCAICREGFIVDDALKRLPCGHDFHDACVVMWLQNNNTCPICRWKMPEATEHDAKEGDEQTSKPSLVGDANSKTRPSVGSGDPTPSLGTSE